MADEAPQVAPETENKAPETEPSRQVPYERFQEVNRKAKSLESQMQELRQQLEERETAGLPELERERKQREQLEKRLQDAEQRATAQERAASDLRKEGWVTAVARDLGFIDPEDALNPRHVDLDGIESREDAERALKKVAKQKSHLIRPTEPPRPDIGRVLTNGQPGAGESTGPADVNDPAFRRLMGQEMLNVLRGANG
jgi:TolA-binding protein